MSIMPHSNNYYPGHHQWYPQYWNETETVTETTNTKEFDGKLVKETTVTKTVSKPRGYRYTNQPVISYVKTSHGNQVQTTRSLQSVSNHT